MVWNAGGFHPSLTGADALRDRGIRLLHIVLSDPDVQEPTLSYLDRFDAVATNALASVDAYWQAGAPFVRHMPFAADRSFVLASVPMRPEWRADVICVGNGRDDRQATMRRLHERCNTRAYGRHWEVPAEPVRGDDLVAALDAGRIHVNFQRTLAGFTNVKVGPFESIGRGGLLCTERFDEMARLFGYDEEIAGYSGTEELVHVIEGLLSDAGRLEQMRRAAFARLVAEHLYEHRWNALFADLREANLLPSEPISSTQT
jgi:spore maturation protein CgeB